jgi:hypothetical protein
MASDEEEEPPANVQRRKQVTSDQRKHIISALTTRMEEGAENCALKYGSLKEVAILRESGKGRVIPLRILQFKLFVLHLQRNVAGLSSGVGMTCESPSKVFLYSTRRLSVSLQKLLGGTEDYGPSNQTRQSTNVIVPHTNSVKPLLTDLNKMSRFGQAESHINLETGQFTDMD